MGAVLNAPSLAVGLEPLDGGQLSRRQIRDEADGLSFAPDVLTSQLGGLGGEGKADIFGGDRAALQGAAFGYALILFGRARPSGGGLQRGKNPWAGRGRL